MNTFNKRQKKNLPSKMSLRVSSSPAVNFLSEKTKIKYTIIYHKEHEVIFWDCSNNSVKRFSNIFYTSHGKEAKETRRLGQYFAMRDREIRESFTLLVT